MSSCDINQHTSVNSLKRYYTSDVAKKIHKYIADFVPYLNNFGSIECSFTEQYGQTYLHLVCKLFVPPPPGFGQDERGGRGGETSPIYVCVVFPSSFPSVPPHCALLAGRYAYKSVARWTVRPTSRVVAGDGALRLAEFPLLRGSAPPYTLMEILVAVVDQFEAEFPLVPVADVDARAGGDAAAEFVQPAAEALMVHLMAKAKDYLDTREQAIAHFDQLFKSGDALRGARDALQARKEELAQYSPAVGEVESVLSGLSNRDDNVAEHSQCIVPVDVMQARALELLGEIHASDDALDLLERSLRAGQLSCDDYVRLVSDVGRKQFEARFLFARVTEAVSRNASQTQRDGGGHGVAKGSRVASAPPREPKARSRSQAPQLPPKIDMVGVLKKEFPEVEKEMIEAVLNLAEWNIQGARVQLKAMLS